MSVTRSQKPADRKKPPGGIQRLRDQIPSMTDAELVTLRGNAERLSKTGEQATEESQKQATTAFEVISLVDVEVNSRKDQKKPAPAAAEAKAPRKRAKASA